MLRGAKDLVLCNERKLRTDSRSFAALRMEKGLM
jgi:hypothetical protein